MLNLCFNLFAIFSKTFVNTLHRRGAQADLILYDGKTHTDLFLQVSMICVPFFHLMAYVVAIDFTINTADCNYQYRIIHFPPYLKLASVYK